MSQLNNYPLPSSVTTGRIIIEKMMPTIGWIAMVKGITILVALVWYLYVSYRSAIWMLILLIYAPITLPVLCYIVLGSYLFLRSGGEILRKKIKGIHKGFIAALWTLIGELILELYTLYNFQFSYLRSDLFWWLMGSTIMLLLNIYLIFLLIRAKGNINRYKIIS